MSNNTILTLIITLAIPVSLAPMVFSMADSYNGCQSAVLEAYSTQHMRSGRLDQAAQNRTESQCRAMEIQAKVYERALSPK